jgi:hypothetical protein
VRRGLVVVLACALVAAFGSSPATARDPGRWVDTSVARFVPSYNQGITIDPSRNIFFDGTLLTFNGLFRTDANLKQQAGVSPVIPADVTARDGYNHIGDLTWDPGEGGRLLLPLECFTPGGPNGGNTCGTGAFGVADPATLQWRYYVKLDPADIPKAMWAETSPDGKLVWTSAGSDLIAYSSADINAAAAAPNGPLLKPVARLAGAVPPHGITGATFYNGRLFLASNVDNRMLQIWSVDTATGQRRLEIERGYRGEPEGLATFTGLGGILHAMILPAFGVANPTFGPSRGALVQFAPAGTVRLRLAVTPGRVRAGRPTRFKFRVAFRALGGTGPVGGATILFAGRKTTADARGRAFMRVTLRGSGRHPARATKRGFEPGTAHVSVGSQRTPRFVG